MRQEQKEALREGKLQIHFPRLHGRKISDVKEILKEVFPNDPSKSVVVGNTTYITASGKQGQWKGSPTPFLNVKPYEIP